LVLDFVYGALGSPVDRTADVRGIKLHNLALVWNFLLEIVSVSLELIFGQGRELIVGNLIGQLLLVEFLDLLIIFMIDLESEFKLLISGIGNAKLVEMFNIVSSDDIDVGRVGWALDAEHAQ